MSADLSRFSARPYQVVTGLNLSGNNLTGRLSDLVEHVLALTALTSLRLADNQLTGLLPAELACAEAAAAAAAASGSEEEEPAGGGRAGGGRGRGEATLLTVLDVSRNRLVGTTPRHYALREGKAGLPHLCRR